MIADFRNAIRDFTRIYKGGGPMIKVHEIDGCKEYFAEKHGNGNGLGITGLVTGVTASALTLAGWAKEFLQSRGGNSQNMAQAVPALCAAIAPVIERITGTACNANTVLNEQAMRIATLEAEKYTDAQIAKLYEYNRANEKELWETKAEVQCLKEKLTDYALNEREKAVLKEQIVDGKIARVQDSVNCLAGKVDDGFRMTNQGFASMNARIDDITAVVVPQSKVCKTNNNGCCNNAQQ
jgi:hypothetical protein